jgi:hypothetical protein
MDELFLNEAEEYPADFPPQDLETHTIELAEKEINGLERLLNANASETELQTFLEANKTLFAVLLSYHRTGHHSNWVVAKQALRIKIAAQNIRGLIPDFIVCGKNSDGFSYWVVEIKAPKEALFTTNSSNEIYFSSELNKGICQLIEYVDFCNEQQAQLRDLYKFEGIREPNGLLIIGREAELDGDHRKQKMKAAWNRIVGAKLEIRTYDWLLSASKSILESNIKSGLGVT